MFKCLYFAIFCRADISIKFIIEKVWDIFIIKFWQSARAVAVGLVKLKTSAGWSQGPC
jgi:hypothetical protein